MSVEKKLILTRTFDAPKSDVYEAFTNADALAQWWGPPGSTINILQLDLTPGGIFLYGMTVGPKEMFAKFTYEEIVPNEKIVFINSFADETGGAGPNPWFDVWPEEIRNELIFEENSGKTTLTWTGAPHNASDEEIAAYENQLSNMQQGFGGTFDRLEEYLGN